MEYVFKAFSDNEEYDADCTYGVVELSKEFLELSLKRLEWVKFLKSEDSSVYFVSYWGGGPEYFAGEDDKDPQNEALANVLEQACATEEFIPLGDLKIDENDFQRTECDQILVYEYGIRFRMIPKHCSFYVESPELSVNEIRELLAKMDAPKQPGRMVLLDERGANV